MKDTQLSTNSYKGVRDFLPKDMAIQRYIFDTWSKTVETFGYERYDASILEPAELYKSKGAANEEIVNDQTYTFIDRGDREVTLRPEMTPTVARMIAAERRELSFPVRWYSIPNLFRYERPQRGRLREHWQLNCDMFGANDYTADVEIIALAYQLLIDFGAKPETFEIRVNNRQLMSDYFSDRFKITDPEILRQISSVLDRKKKVSEAVFTGLLKEILPVGYEDLRTQLDLNVSEFVELLNLENQNQSLLQVQSGLQELGISNVVFDASLARGFNYYTGTIFEVFDISGVNNRSLIGGGRYDNLTGMFSDEPISGVGFGMGDVTMRDFLATHGLLDGKVTTSAATLTIIPAAAEQNLEAQKIAQLFRHRDIKTAVDMSNKKIGKKITEAAKHQVRFILVIGSDEIATGNFILKDLTLESSQTGNIDELLALMLAH